MKVVTTISIILNIPYLAIVILFFLDGFTNVEIKYQPLKTAVYCGFLIGTAVIFIWNLIFLKNKLKKAASLFIPVCMLGFIFYVDPLRIFFASSAWQTQTILYENRHSTNRKIEYQMQSTLRYNQREVEVLYLTSLFMFVKPKPLNTNNAEEWIKVDKEVNELGLK